jgi:lipopolysaccharide exporter
MKDLGRQSAIAFLWGAGGSVIKIILQLGIQVILARLLGPAEYGLFALGVIVVGLGAYFSDLGLAYGLIQKQSVSVDDVRFVWTWQCILGVSVASAIFLSADLLTTFFSKPEAEFIFQWLSLVILINAFTAISTNLLKKSLNYKVLQIAHLSSYCLGFGCVGIPLAVAGFSGTSLVAAWLVQSITNLVILYSYVRHPLTFKLWTATGGHMLRYGATVFATNLINWALNNADKILVGRIFPASVVGLYTTAFNFVNSPSSTIYVNLQSIVFSAGARLQDDHEALRQIFLRLLSLITLVAFPLFMVIGVGSEFIIVTVYGHAWINAAQFLTPFALVMPFLLVWGISTPILWNSGHTKLEFWLQLPLVFVWLAALYAVSNSTPKVVAIVAASLFASRCLIIALAVGRAIKISPLQLFGAVQGGILLTLIVAAVSILLKPGIAAAEIHASVQLFLLLAAGVITYLTSICLLTPILINQYLVGYLTEVNDQLPSWARLIVGFLFRGQKK